MGVYGADELDDIASRDIPAGQRAVRMKDVTPKELPIAPPDIPDEADTESEVEDAPIDPKMVLAKLTEDLAECGEDKAARMEVWEGLQDLVGRMSSADQLKAEQIMEAS